MGLRPKPQPKGLAQQLLSLLGTAGIAAPCEEPRDQYIPTALCSPEGSAGAERQYFCPTENKGTPGTESHLSAPSRGRFHCAVRAAILLTTC